MKKLIDNSIIKVLEKNLCTGCSACATICPVNAIKIIEDKHGFLMPKINKSKCINCGKCKQGCPILSSKEGSKPLSCFSAWSSNSQNLLKSSSGGIFYELAKLILKEGGFVAGVIMKGNRPVHILSNKIKDIKKMRGSKYVQSNTLEIFKKIMKIDGSKKILYIGTPCQVVAMENLYKCIRKNKDNLITCNLVCHGVPSFKVFDEYLNNILEKSTDLKKISFRDKTFGWEDYSIKINSSNDSEILNKRKKDKFMQIFLSDLYLRDSCYNCKFVKIPLQSDITLGDFWGVPKKLKNNKGTSAIIINTNKGEEIIKQLINSKKIIAKKTNLNNICAGNPKLITGKTKRPLNREKFVKIFNSKGFDYAYKKMIKPMIIKRKITSLIVGIKNRIFCLFKK